MAFLERLKLRRSASAEAGAPGPLAPPIAPKLKARITELGQLFFAGRGARRLFPSAKLEDAPPDPSKILFPDGEGGKGDGRAGQYDKIAEQLARDARDLDIVELSNADKHGRKIAGALLSRSAYSAIGTMAFFVQAALWITFFSYVGVILYRVANKTLIDGLILETLYVLTGALFALCVVLLMDAAEKQARRRFQNEGDQLVELVKKTTKRFHEKLVEQRANMEANAAVDFPGAIRAASEARLVTVSALRFFQRSPVIDCADGKTSEVLMKQLRGRAGSGLRAASITILTLLGALAAFTAGAATLYFGAAEEPKIAMVSKIVDTLTAFNAAQSEGVLIVLAVTAVVIAPILIGPLLTLINASAKPGGFLEADPTCSLVAGLRAKALAAVKERKSEFIERYADALLSLERRARDWAERGASEANAADDTPAWRKAPEGPRFVETGFQAAPKSFLVDPATGSARRRGRFPGKKN